MSDVVRIQVLSDVHLEIERIERSGGKIPPYTFDFPARADILALLGDIGNTYDGRLFDWIRVQLRRFKTVFFIPGNHEPYWSSLDESNARLAEFATECDALASSSSGPVPGHFVLLDRTRYDVSPSVTILGCTLWSHLNPDDLDVIRWSLNDFRRIKGFNPTIYQSLHDLDVAWLEATISEISQNEPERKVVVMTHHAPTVEGACDPKFRGGPSSSAFSTELVGRNCWKGKVTMWIFGHTHWSCDFEREGVRVVSNQRGYNLMADSGDKRFVEDKVVEV